MAKKKTARGWLSFVSGAAAYAGASMFWQDYMGKEEYIRTVTEKWVDLSPVIGALIVVIACLLFYHFGEDA